MAIAGLESRFSFISFSDLHLMGSIDHVKLDKMLSPTQSIQWFTD